MQSDSPQEPPLSDEAPSKSARKRAHKALQSLASELMKLSASQLQRIPLGEELREAVQLGSGLRKSARVRQVRNSANLLAEIDAQPIVQALASLQTTTAIDTGRLHRAERWRERLLAEGDVAVNELVTEFPHTDRQRLRNLIRIVHDERAKQAPPRRFRELLRFVRALEEQAQSEQDEALDC